eukprot:c8740_g1_i1.p1 GENE.c8740_g1_i1~~c8740_g1_i1.p1  ORF type:complete len:264 (+),score=35.68 c8740_g1_i1:77-793(+)
MDEVSNRQKHQHSRPRSHQPSPAMPMADFDPDFRLHAAFQNLSLGGEITTFMSGRNDMQPMDDDLLSRRHGHHTYNYGEDSHFRKGKTHDQMKIEAEYYGLIQRLVQEKMMEGSHASILVLISNLLMRERPSDPEHFIVDCLSDYNRPHGWRLYCAHRGVCAANILGECVLGDRCTSVHLPNFTRKELFAYTACCRNRPCTMAGCTFWHGPVNQRRSAQDNVQLELDKFQRQNPQKPF